jgi:hypothetical protein
MELVLVSVPDELKLIPWSILPVRMTYMLHVPGNLQSSSPLYTVTMNKLRKHSIGGKKEAQNFFF